MPSSTVEDYLKEMLKLQGPEEKRVSTGSLARTLGVAPGTVTSMMKTLSESGLVAYEPYEGAVLTDAGRQLAIHVLRRHRLVELFLVQVLGMDWSEVHVEAEQLEHAVSDAVIERIDEFLGHPSVDPHGDPIPDRDGVVEEWDAANLTTCPVGASLEIVRVLDQDPDFLRLVESRGLSPGETVTVARRDTAADSVELEGERKSLSLGFRAAAKIFVRSREEG